MDPAERGSAKASADRDRDSRDGVADAASIAGGPASRARAVARTSGGGRRRGLRRAGLRARGIGNSHNMLASAYLSRSAGMTRSKTLIVFVAGVLVGGAAMQVSVMRAQGSQRVFELRTYTAPDGKLGALESRFRDHTRRIFDKHGMTSIGYWVPQDAPRRRTRSSTSSRTRAATPRRRTGPTLAPIPNGRKSLRNRRRTAAS